MLENGSLFRRLSASLFLLFSLGLFVHPIPSRVEDSYLFSPFLFGVFCLAFFTSRVIERGKKTLLLAVVETAMFLAIGYISHLTVSKLITLQ